MIMIGESPDPSERERLPFFKDPKIKFSIWTILKDSIGKELSKISVPVYFNEPLGILQKGLGPFEFSQVLDDACNEPDKDKRLALACLFFCVQMTTIEKMPSKPFNPLLGETYEFIMPGKYKFLGEQVSHHPPVSAFYTVGESGYVRTISMKVQTSFSKGTLYFNNGYKEYLEIPRYGESFVYTPGKKSIHNLIIGTPYLEISGKVKLVDRSCPTERFAEVEFFKRGWSDANCHKLSGNVYSSAGVVAYRIEGKYSKSVSIINAKTGAVEYTWTKEPYP